MRKIYSLVTMPQIIYQVFYFPIVQLFIMRKIYISINSAVNHPLNIISNYTDFTWKKNKLCHKSSFKYYFQSYTFYMKKRVHISINAVASHRLSIISNRALFIWKKAYISMISAANHRLSIISNHTVFTREKRNIFLLILPQSMRGLCMLQFPGL